MRKAIIFSNSKKIIALLMAIILCTTSFLVTGAFLPKEARANTEFNVSTLESLMDEFEQKVSSNIYMNLNSAYNAYVYANKCLDSYYYGKNTGDLQLAYNNLKTAVDGLTSVWSKYTANEVGYYGNYTANTDNENSYSDLLYCSQEISYGSDHTTVANFKYKINTPNCVVMLYDGDNKPGLPVLAETLKTSGWGSNYKIQYIATSTDYPMQFQRVWYGYSEVSEGWLKWPNLSESMGSATGWDDRDFGYYYGQAEKNLVCSAEDTATRYSKNVLYFVGDNTSFTDNDGYSALFSNIGYYSQEWNTNSTGVNTNAASLYVVNYSPLVNEINNAKSFLGNISQYKEGELTSYITALDTATSLNPNTYFGSTTDANASSDVNSCAAAIKSSYDALSNARTSIKDITAYDELRNAIKTTVSTDELTKTCIVNKDAYIAARTKAVNAIENIIAYGYSEQFDNTAISEIASDLITQNSKLVQYDNHDYCCAQVEGDKAIYQCSHDSTHAQIEADISAYNALSEVYDTIDLNKYDETGAEALENAKDEFDLAIDSNSHITANPQEYINNQIASLLTEIATQNSDHLATFSVVGYINGAEAETVSNLHYSDPHAFTYQEITGKELENNEVITEWKLVQDDGVTTTVNSSETSMTFSLSDNAKIYITTETNSTSTTSSVMVQGQRNNKCFATTYVDEGSTITVNGNNLLVNGVVIMTAPQIPFYTNVSYWKVNGQECKNGTTFEVGSETIIAVPQYGLKNSYTVSIASGSNGTITTYASDNQIDTTNNGTVQASFDEKLLLTTDDADFYAWALVKGDSYEIVSYDKNFTLFCEGNATYKIIKKTDSNSEEYLPYVRIRDASMASVGENSKGGCLINNANGKYKVSIISQLVKNNSDNEYTVEDCGVVISTSQIDKTNFEIGSTGVRKLSSSSQTVGGQYSITCSSRSEFTYLTARAYVTYTYKYEGNVITTTTYSDPVIYQ